MNGEMINVHKVLSGKPDRKKPLGRHECRWDSTKILVWTEFNWLQKGPVVGSCKHSNEPLAPIRGREILEQLSNYQILKKVSVPYSQSVGWLFV